MKFEIGHNADHIIREVEFRHPKLKCTTIAFLSDFHCNSKSQEKIQRIIDSLEALNPDVVLMGGDYIDSKKGETYFSMLLEYLSKRSNVISILGNHDYFYGRERIFNLFQAHKLHLLEKSSVVLNLEKGSINISNSQDISPKRFDLEIKLFHKPKRVKTRGSKMLVVSGHLHGGQVVFNKDGNILYPGRLFYYWNRLLLKEKETLYVISRGLGDTLPLRFNCPKEIVLIKL